MKRQAPSRNLIGAALAVGLILGAVAPPAAAQEGLAQPDLGFKPKSGTTATAISFIGTVVPWALLLSLSDEGTRDHSLTWVLYLSLAAIPVGPSLGHFYAGSTKRAWGGIGLRAVSMAAFTLGVGMAFDEEHDANYPLTLGLIIGGATVLIGSTVADIVDAHKSASRHNLRGRGLSVTVAPVLSPKTKAVGLQANISF